MPQQPPPDIQQTLALALRHHQAGHLNEAEELYRRILQVVPNHADALHFLGVIAHQSGRNDSAVELIGKAIAVNGRVPAFHNNQGNALKALDRLEEAAAAYRRALTHKPDHVEAHYNLGIVLQAQGKLEEALASLGKALAYRPDHAGAHNNLGSVLQEQGKLEAACAAFGRALSVRPDYAEAHSNLGNVLAAQGKLDEAIASHQRALALKPDYAQVHTNLGLALSKQGRLDEAVASFQRAMSFKPNDVEALFHLGNALRELGRLDEAAAAYQRALSVKPDHAESRLGLAMAAIPVFTDSAAVSSAAIARFSQSLDDLQAWSAANPGKLGHAVGADQPFYLAYRPADVTASLCRYGELVSAVAANHWRPEAAVAPASRDSRIRIVIVSGQVRRHPVWDVILRGIIAHIDRTRFEILVYHTGWMTDAETQWARSHVDSFVQGPKPVKGWLAELARDRPDVLFYPEVGMDPATCTLASLRLAPLQIASWGHPVTTGLPTIDLFLSAELLEGPRSDSHYREKLVRLPGTGVCTEWATPSAASPRWLGPARPAGVVRFALCQQPIKFDPADDALLVSIARAAGPCELWLATPNKLTWSAARLRDRLSAAFRAEGLDPDLYLRAVPWMQRAEFSGFLDEMDVYLDCPAFSGYTTALQAIHCGVPIVTLEGEFLRQRLAAGLLRQIGVTDGIATSREQYARIAVQWAHESRTPSSRAARRNAIRQGAPNSNANLSSVKAFEQTVTDALALSENS